MNILCATDDNYAAYCGIMLTSLFENNKDQEIIVYILTAKLSDENNNHYENLANLYNQTIKIVKVNESTFEGCPIKPNSDHISIAAYYRLAVATLLPQGIDTILYLDCDIIVNQSLTDLITADISNSILSAVYDEAYASDTHYKRLKLDKNKYKYFNSGVLLINLKKWEESNVETRCFDFISKNRKILAFHDQDTLNMVLKDEVTSIPVKYNFQTGFITKTIYEELEENVKEEISHSVNNPVIIHYTGPYKPWATNSKHPYAKIWRKYHDISLWADTPLLQPYNSCASLKNRLREVIVKIIWALHIKKRPQTYIISHKE